MFAMSGGFYKYRCKHFLTYNCNHWVYVAGAACASCLVSPAGYEMQTMGMLAARRALLLTFFCLLLGPGP